MNTGIRSGDSGDGRGSTELRWPVRPRGTRRTLGRLLQGRFLAGLCLALAAALLTSAPALASGQRTHVFSFPFGEQGKGAGQFSHPSGIAVSATTGDVYVADREDNRVEQFKPVLGGGGQLEKETLVREWAVPHPEAIAVDNCTTVESSKEVPCPADPSAGDVYVVGAKKLPPDVLVYKFSAEGTAVGGKPLKFKSPVEGVDADPNGKLFVYDASGRIAVFNDAVENAELSHVQAGTKGTPEPGLAVNSKDDLYIGTGLRGTEAEEEHDKPLEGLIGTIKSEYEALHDGQHVNPPVVAALEANTGTVTDPALDLEVTTAVAVNPAATPANEVDELNDAYVLNVSTVAGEQVTTVSAFGPNPVEGENHKIVERQGQLIQRFTTTGLKEGDAIAVSPSSGVVYVADAAANNVDVFTLQPGGRPVVEGLSAQSAGPKPPASNATTLTAQINPAGAKTTDHFEYGTVPCFSSPGACTSVEAPEAGENFGAREVSSELLSLAPGLYHFRIVAENANGETKSPEQTFTVVGRRWRAARRAAAWEMVSPAEKNGAEPEASPKKAG